MVCENSRGHKNVRKSDGWSKQADGGSDRPVNVRTGTDEAEAACDHEELETMTGSGNRIDASVTG